MADSIAFGGKLCLLDIANLKRYPTSFPSALPRNPISNLAFSKYNCHKVRFFSNNSILVANETDTKIKRDSIIVSAGNGPEDSLATPPTSDSGKTLLSGLFATVVILPFLFCYKLVPLRLSNKKNIPLNIKDNIVYASDEVDEVAEEDAKGRKT